MGFNGPSTNIQRTVYETILRGYLFIVNPNEARLYHDKLGSPELRVFLKSRRDYGHSYLCEELFDSSDIPQMKVYYSVLCKFAHADIQSVFLDFPVYSQDIIEDKLKIILMLIYGNIQMFSEMFLTYYNAVLKDTAKLMLKETAASKSIR